MPSGRPKGSKDKAPRKLTEEGRHRKPIQLPANVLPEGVTGDYNARLIRFMLETEPNDFIDRHDPDAPDIIRRRFEDYLCKCAQYEMKIGNLAAYRAIGISRKTALEWENDKNTPLGVRNAIKKVRQFCTQYRETLMQDGKINPVTGIFWQKNYDGLKDQQDVVITPNNPLGEQASPEQLAERYMQGLPKPEDDE